MVKNRVDDQDAMTEDVQNLARIAVVATEYQQQILEVFPRIVDDVKNLRDTQVKQHAELLSAIQRIEHRTQVQIDNAFQQMEQTRKQHAEEVARLMEIIKLHVSTPQPVAPFAGVTQQRLPQGIDPRAYQSINPSILHALQMQQLQQSFLQQGLANLSMNQQPQSTAPIASQNISFSKPVGAESASNQSTPVPSSLNTTANSTLNNASNSLHQQIPTSPLKEVKPVVPTSTTGFGDKFKLQPGEWNCSACYAKNNTDQCVCCGTKKDGTVAEKNIFAQQKTETKPAVPKGNEVKFGFSGPATTVTSTAPAATTTTTPVVPAPATVPAPTLNNSATSTPKFSFGKPAFGGATEKPAATPNFSFKTKESTTPQTASPAFGGSGASTGSSSIFGGGLAQASSLLTNAAKGSASIFDNANSAQAAFANLSKSKPLGGGELKSPSKDENEEGGEDNAEEYEPDVHFNPVIPLPALIEVVTGEENEKVVFKHRAKIFRFDKDTRENKERGVGDLKILLDETKGTYRVVMRREQVHKLCANFRISKGMKLVPKPNAPNVYTVVCLDFAEDPQNGSHETLTVKFKTEETAKEFADIFNKVASGDSSA